jgi:hypothetical protein
MARGMERGAVLPIVQCFELGRRWYEGRLRADWRRPTVDVMEAILREVGLTAPFWRLRD